MSIHLVLEIWVDLTHKKTTFMNEFQKLNLRKLSIYVVDHLNIGKHTRTAYFSKTTNTYEKVIPAIYRM